MSETSLQDCIDAATYEFTLGDSASAEDCLRKLLENHPDSFEAWHALTEVYYAQKKYKAALEAATAAHKLCPEDIHINTSLSRIWVQCGDKEQAEHFGAQARMLSWKQELKSPPPEADNP
ncbi:MAG: Beta-barrel assembly-enhancing protease [Opitutia bacterium UBA7350]|nr:MAG: Beta-barrel assembly-enhancing protease [Opitutae bacterium UBA7350]